MLDVHRTPAMNYPNLDEEEAKAMHINHSKKLSRILEAYVKLTSNVVKLRQTSSSLRQTSSNVTQVLDIAKVSTF